MERKYGEEDRSHLEIEVDALNEQLQARTESQEMAEEALMEAQRDFEAHLSELNSEVELLASTLDAEVAQRKSAEKEVCVCACVFVRVCVFVHLYTSTHLYVNTYIPPQVACLQSQVEHKASELNEMARKKAKEEQQLWEKLEESTMETSVVEEELSSARYDRDTSRRRLGWQVAVRLSSFPGLCCLFRIPMEVLSGGRRGQKH